MLCDGLEAFISSTASIRKSDLFFPAAEVKMELHSHLRTPHSLDFSQTYGVLMTNLLTLKRSRDETLHSVSTAVSRVSAQAAQSKKQLQDVLDEIDNSLADIECCNQSNASPRGVHVEDDQPFDSDITTD